MQIRDSRPASASRTTIPAAAPSPPAEAAKPSASPKAPSAFVAMGGKPFSTPPKYVSAEAQLQQRLALRQSAAQLPPVQLPHVELPKIQLPHIELPHLSFPKLPSIQDVKDTLKREFLGPDFPKTTEQLAAENKRILAEFDKPLKALPPAHAQVLDQIRSLGMSNVDLFRGSHAQVADGGKLYEQWKSVAGAHERTSSHYPDVNTAQYEIPLKGMGTVLFGKDAKGNTWFQMEAHSKATLLDKAFHYVDFFKHQVSGHQNIGPAGYSPHSEKQGTELHFNYPSQRIAA